MRHIIYNILLISLALTAVQVSAQSIDPTITYRDGSGEEGSLAAGDTYNGSAPMKLTCTANPSGYDDWTSTYEWRFTIEGEDAPYLIRYEQDTEYTLTRGGSHKIVCYATFTKGDMRDEYTEEYWSYDVQPFSIGVESSKLEMPNIFTPNNGDDYNNIYRAKPTYKSIVEFRAIIFNRWGTKLYEWHDPAGGWDGKYKGRDMPQGVYFVLVNAKGADGRTFTIKRDVNLIRDYNQTSSSTTPSE